MIGNTTAPGQGMDWGAISEAISSVVGGFNYKQQKNELELAQLNASAANAQAMAANAQPKSNTTIWLVVIAAIVIIALFLMFKK